MPAQPNRRQRAATPTLLVLTVLLAVAAVAAAGEWPHWRGPQRDGTAVAEGLVADWSPEGHNLLWRADFVGRSTPVVAAGRVCVNGRVGEGVTRQETAACFDAGTGEKLWERRWNVYNTTVPWNRVGWPNPVLDPATGYLYVQGVGGLFFCFDSRDGSEIWSKNFIEEYGFMEGYGGRTQTPVVDGDRLVVTFVNSSWGGEAIPRHRFRIFDKRTGELLMVAEPGGGVADKNTQSTPAVARVGDRRLYIHGNADGAIHAIDSASGESVWSFRLSQRGINTSVVARGDTVWAAHSEENLDEVSMGRVVAIDASGSGDVTATHERWRAPLAVGFASPALAGDTLYVLDNSADLHALDAASGERRWQVSVGRVGKASPVVADGKLYVTEVNGVVAIADVEEAAGTILDREEVEMPEGRYAEVYGSIAVAYGRLYFTTEEGLYCVGDPKRPFAPAAGEPFAVPALPPAPAGSTAAHLRIAPAEIRIDPAGAAQLRVVAFDALGRELVAPAVEWSLDGLAGTVADGRFVPAEAAGSQAGLVRAEGGGLEATARVRVVAPLPLVEGFESTEPGSRPSSMLGYVTRFAVEELDGNRVLAKGPSPQKIDRHITFLGAPEQAGYTIEADLMSTRTGRRVADLGLINGGYTMELLGAHQQLQVRSWPSELRMAQAVDFTWVPDVWYRMKLRVDADEERALIRGKVWQRGEAEPAEWTISVEDPLPIASGSPGLSGYSPTPIYFDNIRVTANDEAEPSHAGAGPEGESQP